MEGGELDWEYTTLYSFLFRDPSESVSVCGHNDFVGICPLECL